MIDNIVLCINNGIRQGNFIEMIDFFRYATFWSFEEEHWPSLIKKPVIVACIETFKYVHLDYDFMLRDFYLNKKEEDQKNIKLKLNH